MRIVDFHSHFFARSFFEALASQSPRTGTTKEKLAALVKLTGMELPSSNLAEHTARWLAELDRSHVDHMVTFASAPEEIGAVTQAMQLANGRMTAMAVCNPLAAGAAAKVDTLLTNNGYRGVLLFPAMHHYSPSDPACTPLWEVLERHRAIAYVHCGMLVVKIRDLLGLPRGYDLQHANPLHLIPAADAHPGVTFCIPHFGAGLFRETLMAGSQCQNIVTDTSSSNAWIRTQPSQPSLQDVFARALDVFGPERIMFGTDSTTFPAGWRADRLTEQRSILEALGVAANDQQQIFAGNADAALAGA
ncbi:MAG: putative TIM-barrel fold metal-dependent hydrolase [Hyphomicrobiaceae bacterium]|jgi:predicted TIM-barrel fold metal-dependent hydrolase